jgi:hypothetical protein
LGNLDGERSGKIECGVPYRFLGEGSRLYSEVKDGSVVMHRVLHKGTFSDFMFRSRCRFEDEAIGKIQAWKLDDEDETHVP